MNVLLLTAHSIAEYDDLRMLTDLGHDVFSIGAYTDPAHPGDEMRPALPQVTYHHELASLCREQRERHAGEPETWAIDWAKADLHPKLIEWADVVIAHHYLDRWIVPQWTRLRDATQVIWRTCGQSDPPLESLMITLAKQGLRIVRYSPKEREFFSRLGAWAGEDALIRFGKYAGDYPMWEGKSTLGRSKWIANLTQDMAGRGEHCGLSYWLAETQSFDAQPAGPGSEKLPGGVGPLHHTTVPMYLAEAGAYLYTGTAPASYTLGLIEAMFVGVPIVTMPASRFLVPGLYEATEIVGASLDGTASDDGANGLHYWLTCERKRAIAEAVRLRNRGWELFDVDVVGPQWQEFLGADE